MLLAQVQFRQGDRAHFGRRQQPVLGLGLQKRFVRVAEQPAADSLRSADRARSGLRTRIITFSGAEFLAGDFGQLALRDPLVGRAEVLAT